MGCTVYTQVFNLMAYLSSQIFLEDNSLKKVFAVLSVLFLLVLNTTGCSPVGSKNGSITYIYAAAAALSLVLLIGCLLTVRKKRFWFILLFSSVLVVNTGYTLLAMSPNLSAALWANRLAYLGSVFLPFSMLMIIISVTNTPCKKRTPKLLLCIAVIIFLIAASPGILPVYYKEVSFAVVDGVSTLVKVYGLLHPLYLLYLVGYFSAMVSIIIRASKSKSMGTTSHAVIIAIAVFVNIGVWFIEQLVSIDFEMLSVSYIISELFLLGVHLVMNENQHLKELVNQVENAQIYTDENSATTDVMLNNPLITEMVDVERIETFLSGLETLTPTENAIYEAHIARVTSKEIMANMNIKESTLKYHNRNLYSKLGVSSRKELLEIHKHIKSGKNALKASHN